MLDIDHALTQAAFATLGIPDLFGRYGQLGADNYFDAFETGKLTAEEFAERVCSDFQVSIERERFDNAWNALLLTLPKSRVQLLRTLRAEYRIYLLSNTNEIHIGAFQASISESHGPKCFESCFDELFFSCRMGVRKPDREIFTQVLQRLDIRPDETLFIDDSAANIEAARQLGIRTIHLPMGDELTEVLPIKLADPVGF